jgi:hypothetical protein
MTRATVLATVFLTVFTFAAPKADAGGYVGVSIGTGGVNLSFGAGSWGLYGSSWHDPSWSVDFNVVLDGYGEWVWVSGLGRVWRPWVAADWRPYTHGRWAWTSAGWTWVAYEPWGWAPHHFGHWATRATAGSGCRAPSGTPVR